MPVRKLVLSYDDGGEDLHLNVSHCLMMPSSALTVINLSHPTKEVYVGIDFTSIGRHPRERGSVNFTGLVVNDTLWEGKKLGCLGAMPITGTYNIYGSEVKVTYDPEVDINDQT